MNSKSQVTNIELSKKLTELGIKQESLWYWQEQLNNEYELCIIHNPWPSLISAFTVAELLNILPHRITLKENEPFNSFRLRIEKSFIVIDNPFYGNELLKENIKYHYLVNYNCDSTSQELGFLFTALTKNMVDENPANALAKMLIYLIENNLHNESYGPFFYNNA